MVRLLVGLPLRERTRGGSWSTFECAPPVGHHHKTKASHTHIHTHIHTPHGALCLTLCLCVRLLQTPTWRCFRRCHTLARGPSTRFSCAPHTTFPGSRLLGGCSVFQASKQPCLSLSVLCSVVLSIVCCCCFCFVLFFACTRTL